MSSVHKHSTTHSRELSFLTLIAKDTATRVYNAAYDICEAIDRDYRYAADMEAECAIVERIDAEIAALAALRGYRLTPANEARAA